MSKPSSFTTDETLSAIRQAANSNSDYRALVCIYLGGGNDSHNMIIPMAGSTNRAPYDTERGTLAIPADQVLPLTGGWGVNPNMDRFATMFGEGKAAVLMNVGMLKEPTNRASYLAKSVELPAALFSHNSQTELWQSLPPLTGMAVNGWMGRAGELAGPVYNPTPFNDIGPCFSISGKRRQMEGYEQPYSDMNSAGPAAISAGDAMGAPGFATELTKARGRSEWGNTIQASMAARVAGAIANQAALAGQAQQLPAGAEAVFTGLSANGLAQQFKMVSRLVHSRSNLGHRRDLFFVSLSGWDDHDTLATGYGPRLALLDDAMHAFNEALKQLGMQEHVVTFTESEFGRALKQNNGGSDHGWGGHALLMGGAVKGGMLYGTPPDLRNGSSNDAAQGRMIPTTSVEQYAATLLKWWGIPEAQLPLVLENLSSFSPATLDMLREPADPVQDAPVFEINLADSKLDPRVTFSTGTGPRLMFNKDGTLVHAPHNLVVNSGFANASVAANAAGSGWSFGSSTGAKRQVVGTGVLPTGEKYIDVRIHGQISVAEYPYLISSSVLATLDTTYLASAKLQILSGYGWEGRVGVQIARLTEAFGHLGTSDLAPATDGPLTRVWSRQHVVNAGANQLLQMRVAMAPLIGVPFDYIVRIAEPMLEQVSRLPNIQPTPSAYVESPPASQYLGPRFDHDPVTKKWRGLLVEGPSAGNLVRNSGLAGAAFGTPGTLPTNYSATMQAGVQRSIVSVGSEDGLPYMDLRIFGTPTATGESALLPDPIAGGAANGQDWTASVYVSVVNGSLRGFTKFTHEVMLRAAGTAKTNRMIDLLAATPKGRLVANRFETSITVTDATVDGADTRLRWEAEVGKPIDVTIRLAGFQLERFALATSPMLTYGTTFPRPGELYTVNDISGWFNPDEGTLAVKAISGIPNSASKGLYPRTVSLNGPVAGNAIDMLVFAGNGLLGNGQLRIDKGGVMQGGGSVSAPSALAKSGEVVIQVGVYAQNYALTAQRGSLSPLDELVGLPTGLDRLTLGRHPSEATRVWFQSFRYWNKKLEGPAPVLLSSL